jgi:hypothetical protein
VVAGPNIGLHFGKSRVQRGDIRAFIISKNELLFVFITLFSARYKC